MSPKGDEMTSPEPNTVQPRMAPSTGRATSMRRRLGSTKASRREGCGLGVGDGFLPSILVGRRWGEDLSMRTAGSASYSRWAAGPHPTMTSG